jgi:hypothetical protein
VLSHTGKFFAGSALPSDFNPLLTRVSGARRPENGSAFFYDRSTVAARAALSQRRAWPRNPQRRKTVSSITLIEQGSAGGAADRGRDGQYRTSSLPAEQPPEIRDGGHSTEIDKKKGCATGGQPDTWCRGANNPNWWDDLSIHLDF